MIEYLRVFFINELSGVVPIFKNSTLCAGKLKIRRHALAGAGMVLYYFDRSRSRNIQVQSEQFRFLTGYSQGYVAMIFHSTHNYLKQQTKTSLMLHSIAFTFILGVFDHAIGSQISFSVFYIAPILLATWYRSREAGFFISILAAAVWLTADLTTGQAYRYFLIPFWNAAVRLIFFVTITMLTSMVKEKIELEESLADTDYLTGLKNSRAFYESIDYESARSRRYKRPFAIAYIDLDNFKHINDALGHDTGDDVLRTVADVVKKNVRESDIVSRLGGDEFAVLFPETGYEATETIIRNFIPVLSQEMKIHAWPISCSIGAITFSKPMNTSREMIKKVDGLMYEVKKAGKNDVIHEEYK